MLQMRTEPQVVGRGLERRACPEDNVTSFPIFSHCFIESRKVAFTAFLDPKVNNKEAEPC